MSAEEGRRKGERSLNTRCPGAVRALPVSDEDWRVAAADAKVSLMAVDNRPQVQVAEEQGDLVVGLVTALQPRLPDLPEDVLRRRVEAAMQELGEVRVTTYLPILVERRVREDLRGPRPPGSHPNEVVRLPA